MKCSNGGNLTIWFFQNWTNAGVKAIINLLIFKSWINVLQSKLTNWDIEQIGSFFVELDEFPFLWTHCCVGVDSWMWFSCSSGEFLERRAHWSFKSAYIIFRVLRCLFWNIICFFCRTKQSPRRACSVLHLKHTFVLRLQDSSGWSLPHFEQQILLQQYCAVCPYCLQRTHSIGLW